MFPRGSQGGSSLPSRVAGRLRANTRTRQACSSINDQYMHPLNRLSVQSTGFVTWLIGSWNYSLNLGTHGPAFLYQATQTQPFMLWVRLWKCILSFFGDRSWRRINIWQCVMCWVCWLFQRRDVRVFAFFLPKGRNLRGMLKHHVKHPIRRSFRKVNAKLCVIVCFVSPRKDC